VFSHSLVGVVNYNIAKEKCEAEETVGAWVDEFDGARVAPGRGGRVFRERTQLMLRQIFFVLLLSVLMACGGGAAREAHADSTLVTWNAAFSEHAAWETAMDWLAGVTPSGPPVAEVLAAIRERTQRHLIVVASSAAIPPLLDVTPVVPADEAGPQHTLVFTPDGQVQAC